MASWFKKKTPAADASELSELMHSMQDDLEGRPIKNAAAAIPAETMTSFTPHSGAGTAFRGETPPRPPRQAPPANLPTSPFLDRAASSSSARTASAENESRGEAQPVPSPEIKPGAPFQPEMVLNAPPSSDIDVPATTLPKPKPWQSPLVKYLLIGGAGVISLAALGWGGYMYWQRSQDKGMPSAPTASEGEMVSEPSPEPMTPPTQRFTTNASNPLSINIETITLDQLRQTLLQTAQEMRDDGQTTALEFTVRDQNLNPIAFSRFAYLFKITLPETLLAALDEPFSIYLYTDGARPRLGLKLTVKDLATFQSELSKNEKTLAQAISPLFLDVTTAPKTNAIFRSGQHAGLTTRFTNIDPTLNLSVDYAIKDPYWFIGTSKNTLWSMLDAGEHPNTPVTPSAKQPAGKAAEHIAPAMLNGSTGQAIDIMIGS